MLPIANVSEIYYQDENHMLLWGDSRDLSPVPSGIARLCLTSPPYFDARNYGTTKAQDIGGNAGRYRGARGGAVVNEHEIGFGQTFKDFLRAIREVWREVYRILVPGGVFVMNMNQRKSDEGLILQDLAVARQAERAGFTLWDIAAWVKLNPQPTKSRRYLDDGWEPLYIFGKGPIALLNKGYRRQNVIEGYIGCFGNARHGDGEHAAVMSATVADWAVEMFTNPGETVLDPFVGEGTTTYAAQRKLRQSVGSELYERYLAKIQYRLATPNPVTQIDVEAALKRPQLVML